MIYYHFNIPTVGPFRWADTHIVKMTLLMELRRRAIKRWVPCGDMDRRLKILQSAKAECGFRTTPEECLYDSGLNGLQYRAS